MGVRRVAAVLIAMMLVAVVPTIAAFQNPARGAPSATANARPLTGGTTGIGTHTALVNGCLRGTQTLRQVQARVAFLVPTFTLTPYYNWGSSFYAFYIKHWGARGNIAVDLGMLKTKAIQNWTSGNLLSEKSLVDFLTSPAAGMCGLVLGKNFHLINDQAVDGGTLFSGGARTYDVLILGHEEYVTKAEYDQLRLFVATGGRLVAMAGNTFYAEVGYNRSTGFETFVAGHGFEFNGRYAWRTGYEPFDAQSSGWFGSTFEGGVYGIKGAVLDLNSTLGRTLQSVVGASLAFTDYKYPHDEVNGLKNMTGTEIVGKFYIESMVMRGVRFFTMPDVPVDSYTHRYRQGEVFCLCVFGESILSKDFGAQFFLVYAVTEGFFLTSAFSRGGPTSHMAS